MTTFGEITEPGSRTAWEDWDDTDFIPDDSSLPLQWQKKLDTPKEIDTFIILEGKYLSDILKSQSKEFVCINSVPEVNLHLYETKANNYICLIKDYNLIWSSEIVELLKGYITLSTNVVVVLCKSLVEHQVAEETTKNCIMRTLSTSKPLKCLKDNMSKLEQPNIISGVGAGVVCLREILDLPAMAIVCYLEQPEQHQVDDELHALLQKLKIVSSIDTKQNDNNILNSNLYI